MFIFLEIWKMDKSMWTLDHFTIMWAFSKLLPQVYNGLECLCML